MHTTHDLRDEVQGDEGVRAVVFFARHCLAALELGNPQSADEALSKMDAGRAYR